MKLKPNVALGFNGQCEAAFRLYAQCLNGTIAYMLRWGDSPAAGEAPSGWDAKIYHATLAIGDAVITGGDLPPERYELPRGFSIVLEMDDPSAAERIFLALAEQGRIQMALQETFWAGRFGSVVDQFGIPWTINCEKGVEPTSIAS